MEKPIVVITQNLDNIWSYTVRSNDFENSDYDSPVFIGNIIKDTINTPFFFHLEKSVHMLSGAEAFEIGKKVMELNAENEKRQADIDLVRITDSVSHQRQMGATSFAIPEKQMELILKYAEIGINKILSK